MAEKEIKVIKKDKTEFVEEEVVIAIDPPELAPNIAFVGEEPSRPLVDVQTATGHFKLPKDQAKPFYTEHAGFLVRTFPHLYKPVTGKGR